MPPALKNLKSEMRSETIPQKEIVTKKPTLSKVKFIGLPLGLVLVILIVLAVLLVSPALAIKNSLLEFKSSIDDIQSAVSTKDLNLIAQKVNQSKEKAEKLEGNFNKLFWVRPLPILGSYVSDGRSASLAAKSSLEASEIVIKTIEPYADILGLKGDNVATDGAKTAQDRINFIVESVDKIAPQLDQIGDKFALASTEINKINPNRYPENYQGYKLRELISQAQTLLSQSAILTHDAKPFLEAAPFILGNEGKRTYLALFQNDAELRPTGGFMTAYAILEVEKGKVKPLFSDDIYKLDDKYKPTLKAPDPLIKYISFPYQEDPRWRLRDMNLSPDFKVAMDIFHPEYEKTNSPKVDGIISVDTQLLVYLLQVIGKIGVPGFGNFSADTDARCNCPNIIYELESYADVAGPIVWDPVSGKVVYRPPHSDNRKGIIGPLMNSILANAVAQPKEKIYDLLQVSLKSVQEKHVMMYFIDPKIQSSVESFNLAGRVRESAGDYLYVVASNMAGAKSNMYLKTDVEDKITVNSDGTANHELTVNYNNPQKHDGWLNGVNRNWFRVYVPKGSELIDSSGSEVNIDTYEEFGKTVYSGFITVRPSGGIARFTLSYKTPSISKNNNYLLLIQKQPGTGNDPYIITLNGKEEDFELSGDKEFSRKIK